MIQNKLISILAEEVLRDIKSELQSAPFFAIILDTTQDVSKKDLLSKVFCYVKIDYHNDGTPFTNQQPSQRRGVVPEPVWVGPKLLLAFPRVPVTPGTPLAQTRLGQCNAAPAPNGSI